MTYLLDYVDELEKQSELYNLLWNLEHKLVKIKRAELTTQLEIQTIKVHMHTQHTLIIKPMKERYEFNNR